MKIAFKNERKMCVFRQSKSDKKKKNLVINRSTLKEMLCKVMSLQLIKINGKKNKNKKMLKRIFQAERK